ncbi:MAG: hypothetical protein JSU70_23330 [Phycisphaerales bacterium]|nr:MAG: hypothetical protein JSU70_23330 [Phycisphaerales bacterium]
MMVTMTTKRMLAALFLPVLALCVGLGAAESDETAAANVAGRQLKSIREFAVVPTNSAAVNRENLQKAIDWAHPRGAALFVEPSDTPYPVDGGIILRANVSLFGVHGPVGRGTRHPDKVQPVGSVFAIEDDKRVFITVENATQIRGIQFWYPKQTLRDPAMIIEYPATIRASQSKGAQGVTLSCLTFYGEFLAMDFNGRRRAIVEQILFEHCYGYPLSGEFIRIDYCYDIPRILHCHVNPSNRRFIDGGYRRAVIDSVVARKTFTYRIDHTDNAQLIDLFTFGVYGGIYLGPATYGQLSNFNFDCVTVGIHKLGDSTFNRNWQIAQGSIIANTGEEVQDVHPLIVEGKGHTSLMNVEAFSGPNGALTTLNKSQDYLLVRGNDKLTITMMGCRMRNYVADEPITILNPNAVIRATGCIDKHENLFEYGPNN